jgi:hypothetical protein
VTVRCGHCTNLLSVNLRGLLLPPAAPPANQLNFGGHSSLLSPTSPHGLLVRTTQPQLVQFHLITPLPLLARRSSTLDFSSKLKPVSVYLFARVQEELALQAPSLLMEQASANLSNITGRSCASNVPAMPMQPAAKPVQHQPELPKSAPSVNRRKDSVFSSLIYLISSISPLALLLSNQGNSCVTNQSK